MNTILITGTAKQKINYQFDDRINPIGFKVQYAVTIWASNEGKQIQLISTHNETLQGYNELWTIAKKKASEYLKNDLLNDGAYTQYLDHIIMI